jgi:hypothetical protein
MYLNATLNSNSEVVSDFFAPKLITPKQLQVTDKVEVWSSSFEDSGPDFNEFRFFRANESTPFLTKRTKGY